MESVEVRYLGSDGEYQDYTPSDLALINKALITPNFGTPDDYVEYFIKNLSGNVLSSNYFDTKYDYGNTNPVTGTTTKVLLDPENDAKRLGYDRGIVNVKYNFLRKFLASSPIPQQNFWIDEISTSRTEIKAARQDLSNDQLANAFNLFNAALAADAYYPDFYLNFGNDVQLIAVNAIYVEENGNGYILFKLYEPLPDQFDLKSTFWVVTKVADSAEFNVSINIQPEVVLDYEQISGPNFKVFVNNTVNEITPYYSYDELFATSVTSSFQQLKSMMDEKGIMINVDYSNFENFIHFSSATERIYNFVYKLQIIESASLGIASTNTSTAKLLLQQQIDNTIEKFDGYEYYLYFESESTAWPKSSSTKPYSLYSVTSSQAVNWLGSVNTVPTATTMSMYYSSSYYDNVNPNILEKTAPGYILQDASNVPYLVFLNMVGQHFDNIWIYLKDITNRYSAENNPFVGISMEEVGNALKSFGINLYTNTSISNNIYYSLLGINADGSLLPPTGSEVITTYVTSSIPTLPAAQLTGEVYKRLYHNLAYLLKTRGTERGARALITTFGIPPDILSAHEFGGYNIYEVAGIQEISNTRIITGSVLQLSSSVLSPFVSIQYFNNDLQKTSGDVEIGFSPADSINASITSSGFITSSTEPGYFNIMQVIGSPGWQYSSSYEPLVQLSNTFFSQSYTGNPVSGLQRYNVKDFVNVIKYYNNSLFKMLKDWVPARASATTGVIVKSHILERNKYPRHEPTATTSSQEANYYLLAVTGSSGGSVTGSTAYVEAIPIQYSAYSSPLSQSFGTVYVSSSDDVQQYTGEFSGSYIQVSDNYFDQIDQTSYIYPWTSSVAPSQHGGQNIMFLTYSLGPTFQNVTGSVISQRFLDLDYNSSQLAPVNFGLITQSLSQSLVIGNVSQSQDPYSQYAQYQDYNQTFRPFIIPRYSGSYLSSLYYNTYSLDDVSFGQDPVINWYSNKLGFFTQIASSSFLPGKVNATLTYLADVSGGLFELNQNNKNWVDVQNIFKAGTVSTIKQFDNKQFSNQVATDGIKTIYNSGYNYSPLLYFISGTDNRLYFEYLGGDTGSAAFVGYNNAASPYISGSASNYYAVNNITNAAIRAGDIYRVYNAEDPTSTDFAPGNLVSWPSYTSSVAGQRQFTMNLGINFQFPSAQTFGSQSGSYSLGAYLNGSTIIGSLQTVNFTSSYTAGGFTNGTIDKRSYDASPDMGSVVQSSIIFYVATGPFTLTTNGSSPSTIGSAASWISSSVYSYTEGGNTFVDRMVYLTSGDISANFNLYNSLYPTVLLAEPTSAEPTSASDIFTATRTINYTTPAANLNPGDKVVFKFRQEGMSTNNFTSSLLTGKANGFLSAAVISVGQGGYPYATSSYSAGNFITNIIDYSDFESQIILKADLSSYTGYQFVPYFQSGSVIYSSSLYTQYGDINYSFNPQYGDKIILQDFSGITQDLDVLESSLNGSNLYITVTPQVLQNWVDTPSKVLRFLLLRKYKDEQNVILTFNKPPGQTSYGFLIPDTISPQVTNNINTLQAAVQSQLLTQQSPPPIDTINGGTFI